MMIYRRDVQMLTSIQPALVVVKMARCGIRDGLTSTETHGAAISCITDSEGDDIGENDRYCDL